MKFLVIRFSSIGDIVLTTPVVRAISKASEKNRIHFITKEKFSSVLEHNPYIDKLITFNKEITELGDILKLENYDYIIDLHSNLRSKRLINSLKKPCHTFNKLNYEKWIKVNFKLDILPRVHIVDRYMNTVSFLGLNYDNKGLDYFLGTDDEQFFENLNCNFKHEYAVMVLGGAHKTKQIPEEILIELAIKSNLNWILLGGQEDVEKAEIIANKLQSKCLNLTGKITLNQSAVIIKYALKVLTPDTGLMHIAAAFNKKIISIWGNTIPEFGMTPLLPKESQNQPYIFEVKELKCRPCSKIGYNKCPKKHFQCMLNQNTEDILKALMK